LAVNRYAIAAQAFLTILDFSPTDDVRQAGARHRALEARARKMP
jgi:hypothetical protein